MWTAQRGRGGVPRLSSAPATARPAHEQCFLITRPCLRTRPCASCSRRVPAVSIATPRVGGGGHAARILAASAPDGRLVGIDRDPVALAAARERLAPFGDRVTLVHGAFGDAKAILTRLGAVPVDGFLVDLGVSSPQLDQAERGFSFQREGPLDMRMDPTRGETCGELLRRIGTGELADLLRRYGDEPFAPPDRARHQGGRSHAQRVASTTDLAAVVAAALPARERAHRKTDPATRTFQALRIAVNDELGQIERFLADFPSCLRTGGRVVVIAFHSLEDHLVKNRLRDLSRHPGRARRHRRRDGHPPRPRDGPPHAQAGRAQRRGDRPQPARALGPAARGSEAMKAKR